MDNLLWIKVKDSETLKKILNGDLNTFVQNLKIQSFGFDVNEKINNENFNDNRSFWIKSDSLEKNLNFASQLAKKINSSILSFDGENFYLFNSFGNKTDINYVNNFKNLFCSLFDYLNSESKTNTEDFAKYIGEKLFNKYNDIFSNLKLELMNYISDLNCFLTSQNKNCASINLINTLENNKNNLDQNFINNINSVIQEKQSYFNKFVANNKSVKNLNVANQKITSSNLTSNGVVDQLLANKQKYMELNKSECPSCKKESNQEDNLKKLNPFIFLGDDKNIFNSKDLNNNLSKELTKEIIEEKIGAKQMNSNNESNSDSTYSTQDCINEFIKSFLNSPASSTLNNGKKYTIEMFGDKINYEKNPALCLHIVNIVKEKQDLFKNFTNNKNCLFNVNLNISLIILQDVTMDEYNSYLRTKNLIWSDSYKQNLILSANKISSNEKQWYEEPNVEQSKENESFNLKDNIKENISSESFWFENKDNFSDSFRNNFSSKNEWFDEANKSCENEECSCDPKSECCKHENSLCNDKLNWSSNKQKCCKNKSFDFENTVDLSNDDFLNSLPQGIDTEVLDLYEDVENVCPCSDDNLFTSKDNKSLFDFIDFDLKGNEDLNNSINITPLKNENKNSIEELIVFKNNDSKKDNKLIDIKTNDKLVDLLDIKSNDFSFDKNKKLDVIEGFMIKDNNTKIEIDDLILNATSSNKNEASKEIAINKEAYKPSFEEVTKNNFVDNSPNKIIFNGNPLNDTKYQEVKFTSDNDLVSTSITKDNWVDLKTLDSNKYSSSLSNESVVAKPKSIEPSKILIIDAKKSENIIQSNQPQKLQNIFPVLTKVVPNASSSKYVEVSFISKPVSEEIMNNNKLFENLDNGIYSSSLSNESEVKKSPVIIKESPVIVKDTKVQAKIILPKLMPDVYPEVYDEKIEMSTNFKNLNQSSSDLNVENDLPSDLTKLIQEDQQNRLNLSKEIESFINELREEKRKLQEKKIILQQNLMH